MTAKDEKILEAIMDYAGECYAEGFNDANDNKWILCRDRKPEPETKVLVTVENTNSYRYVTTAFYENGKINTEDSAYGFTDTAYNSGWEYIETKDAFIIPESWWEDDGGESVFKIDDGVYDVIAWQALPAPYQEESNE